MASSLAGGGSIRGQQKRRLTLTAANMSETQLGVEPQGTPENPVLGSYIMGDVLGKGSFGAVYRGINTETGEFVAIKYMEVTKIEEAKLVTLRNEINKLKSLDHPNLVRFLDVFSTKQSISLIIEYVESGSLASIVDNFGSFPEQLTCLYVAQCLKCLAYLHDAGVVHRDIKGANVLITKNGEVKLTDFGLSKSAMAAMGNNLADVAPYWIAPEVITSETIIPEPPSDVWSLGCTVIELYTGQPPFFQLAPSAAVLKIIELGVEVPTNCSEEMQAFLKLCLDRDPSKRGTPKTLLQHPWLQKHNASVEIIDTVQMLKSHVQDNKDAQPHAEYFRRMSLTPNLGGEAPLPSESRITVKVFVPTIDQASAFKTVFISDRTTASTIISVALSKINGLEDKNPAHYYFCELLPSTKEERRFAAEDLPMGEYTQVYLTSQKTEFHIKRLPPAVKEGFLKLKAGWGSWSNYYFVLDGTEKYFAFYERKPADRNAEKAKAAMWNLSMVDVFDYDPSNPTLLHVQSANTDWQLQAASKEDAVEWINELRHKTNNDVLLMADD